MSIQRWIATFILALILSLALSEAAYAQNKASSSFKVAVQPTSSRMRLTPNLAVNESTSFDKTSLRTSVAPEKEIKKLKGTWSFGLQQKRFEDSFHQKSVSEFRLLADFQYFPLEAIYFRLVPQFNYTNGFVQAEETGSEKKSNWGVKEASINAMPSPFLKASLGALSQEETHPSILLYDQTFASARLTVQTNPENDLNAGVTAETGIPTSNSLSTQSKEFEKTPSFSSASLLFKAQRTLIEGWIQAGAYEFQNLPMSISTQSGLLGNTTQPTSGTDSIFNYDYKGAFADSELKARLGKHLTLGVNAEWVRNNQAPNASSQGTLSRAFVEIPVSRNFETKPFYEFFRIEPDATVAAYNAESISTNRVGYNAGLVLTYRKIMRMTIAGGERDVIYLTPFQQKERTWYLRLETFDVAI